MDRARFGLQRKILDRDPVHMVWIPHGGHRRESPQATTKTNNTALFIYTGKRAEYPCAVLDVAGALGGSNAEDEYPTDVSALGELFGTC